MMTDEEQRKAQTFIERNRRWFQERIWKHPMNWIKKLDDYNQRVRNLRGGQK